MSSERSKLNKALVSVILITILVILIIVGYFAVSMLLNVDGAADGLFNLPEQIVEQVDQFVNPTPTITVDPGTVIKQIQSLSRLETASYTIEKVITAQAGGDDVFSSLLFGDKLLLVAQGQVVAGVDLEKLDESDLVIDGKTVYIVLPEAEVFITSLDNDNSYVYDRQTGLLGQQVDLETQARQEAERAILEAALEDGILDKAQENAEQVITGILLAVGMEEVFILPEMIIPIPAQ